MPGPTRKARAMEYDMEDWSTSCVKFYALGSGGMPYGPEFASVGNGQGGPRREGGPSSRGGNSGIFRG
eukprot:5230482-Pyramimonas_sp.AAC.1